MINQNTIKKLSKYTYKMHESIEKNNAHKYNDYLNHLKYHVGGNDDKFDFSSFNILLNVLNQNKDKYNFQNLTKHNKELIEEKNQLTIDKNQLITNNNNLNKKIIELNEKIIQQQNEIDIYNQNIQQIKDKIKKYEKIIEQITEKITLIDKTQSEKITDDNMVEKIIDIINKITPKKNQKKKELEDMMNRLDEKQKQYIILEKELADTKKSSSETEKIIERLNIKYNLIVSKLEIVNIKLSDSINENKQLVKKFDDYKRKTQQELTKKLEHIFTSIYGEEQTKKLMDKVKLDLQKKYENNQNENGSIADDLDVGDLDVGDLDVGDLDVNDLDVDGSNVDGSVANGSIANGSVANGSVADDLDAYNSDTDGSVKSFESNESNISDKLKDKIKKIAMKAKGKKNERDEKFIKKNCNIVNKYVNIDLDINIIGTSQPYYNSENIFDTCADLLVKENIKLYITFNQYNEALFTEKEKTSFEKACTDIGCKFESLPVPDWTAPSSNQLLHLWRILDEFYKTKKEIGNFKYNVLMHCTAGFGRTGFMIMSYIWYKKILMDPTFSPYYKDENLGYSIKEYIEMYNSSTTEHEKTNIHTTIKTTKILIFLRSELEKYNHHSAEEVFNGSGKLFFNRLSNFCEAIIGKKQEI